jgi:hypothetical protein
MKVSLFEVNDAFTPPPPPPPPPPDNAEDSDGLGFSLFGITVGGWFFR